MGYLCATCGGMGGLFETSHAHSDKDSCIAELKAEKAKMLLQIRELQEIVDLAVDLGGVSFHEESCPQDDTCFCVDVARVNKAMKGFEPSRQAGSINLPITEKRKCPSVYTHTSFGRLECEKDEGHLHRVGDVEHQRGKLIWMSV